MKIEKAIAESDCKMAEFFSPRAQHIWVAMETRPGEIRIVKDVTDPTVVRRLRLNEADSGDWVPVQRCLITDALRRV
jgi:hypothetical protein